jgi:hypothetical protein
MSNLEFSQIHAMPLTDQPQRGKQLVPWLLLQNEVQDDRDHRQRGARSQTGMEKRETHRRPFNQSTAAE